MKCSLPLSPFRITERILCACGIPMLVLALAPCAGAQNLVPNPGFEDHIDCTGGASPISIAYWYWVDFNWRTEYFHACSNGPDPVYGVPENQWGFQYPHGGDGYAGIMVFATGDIETRAYLAAPLSQQLDAGVEYCASFWINRANESRYTVDSIHILLTPQQPFNISDDQDSIWGGLAQMRVDITAVDSITWLNVESSFVASGGEDWVILGDFQLQDDADTTCIDPGFTTSLLGAAFLVDDVYIARCDVSTPSVSAVRELDIYPVPLAAGSSLQVPWAHASGVPSFIVQDVQGREVMRWIPPATQSTYQLPTTALVPGTYALTATSTGARFVNTFIVQ